jgi:DNA modification methylase
MQITPYEKNAKKHPEAQLRQLALSLREYGWRQPIVVDKDNVIIVGHGRYMAYQKYPDGIAEPWIVKADDLTHEQVKGYRLMDNKSNESDWDMGLVVEELKELDEANFPIELTGFDSDLLIYPEDKDDEIPDSASTRAQLGDIWLLGEHRVMCGDSTKQGDVERLMEVNTAELLFTSPPYSDMREYNGEKNLETTHLSKFISTFMPFANYQVVNLGMQRKNGEVFEYWNDYIAEARSVGYKFLSWNIWRQDGAGSIGKQTAFFPIEHEWLFVFGKDFKNIKRTEKRKTSKNEEISTHREADGSVVSHNVGRQEAFKELGTVLELPSEKTAIRKEHPATYPVMLPQKFIEVMTNNGDSIIDPFLGSGSTLVAAEKTGRICYGMELDPKYVDVILKRWEDFTGKIAIKV